jgi:hypothetical protein
MLTWAAGLAVRRLRVIERDRKCRLPTESIGRRYRGGRDAALWIALITFCCSSSRGPDTPAIRLVLRWKVTYCQAQFISFHCDQQAAVSGKARIRSRQSFSVIEKRHRDEDPTECRHLPDWVDLALLFRS